MLLTVIIPFQATDFFCLIFQFPHLPTMTSPFFCLRSTSATRLIWWTRVPGYKNVSTPRPGWAPSNIAAALMLLSPFFSSACVDPRLGACQAQVLSSFVAEGLRLDCQKSPTSDTVCCNHTRRWDRSTRPAKQRYPPQQERVHFCQILP